MVYKLAAYKKEVKPYETTPNEQLALDLFQALLYSFFT